MLFKFEAHVQRIRNFVNIGIFSYDDFFFFFFEGLVMMISGGMHMLIYLN